jgi:hypothetical protein
MDGPIHAKRRYQNPSGHQGRRAPLIGGDEHATRALEAFLPVAVGGIPGSERNPQQNTPEIRYRPKYLFSKHSAKGSEIPETGARARGVFATLKTGFRYCVGEIVATSNISPDQSLQLGTITSTTGQLLTVFQDCNVLATVARL